MSPLRRRALAILLIAGAVALVVAPEALASAGGGSSGFSGGGGGGGGGGSGFALFILFDLLIHIAVLGHGLGALFLLVLAAAYLLYTRVLPNMSDGWRARAAQRGPHRPRGRRNATRERRVELAAAEAAESDPAFAADEVRSSATTLFQDIQEAWDADDRRRLRSLVGPDLLGEWERRLDDFDRRGWRNHVQVLGEPSVQLVGLTHRGEADTDRVVVRGDARR
jgi:predicted lipid-binding transport protein (Tim44 family)